MRVAEQDEDASPSGGDSSPGVGEDDSPSPHGLMERPAQQTCRAFTAPVTNHIRFVDRFPHVRFDAPVSMTQRPSDNTRFYVNERLGRIYSFPNDPAATNQDKVLALDLSDVQFDGFDCAAASLAFPPNFFESGVAYVTYCHQHENPGNPLPHVQLRLSRFYSSDSGITFDRQSEQVIVAINYLESADPYDPTYGRECSRSADESGIHAGNAAKFGPDGYLYWSIGDGGPQGHCGGRQAQHLSTLRGKMLRMDVSDVSKAIGTELLDFAEGWQLTAADAPPDNPFPGDDPNPSYGISEGVVQPLVFAYGFRNPWQWSFDPQDGTIWLGDVGNNTWEEVNRNIVAGGNYGWGYFEGYYCANDWDTERDPVGSPEPACATHQSEMRWPMLAMAHAPFYDVSETGTPAEHRTPATMYGRSITGGVVYSGHAVPSFTGSYIFGDFSTQRIWAIRNVDALSTESGSTCSSSADCGAGLVCRSYELPYENGYPSGIVGAPPAAGRCTANYELVQAGPLATSFGRDQDGEIYGVMMFGAPVSGNGWIGMLRDTTGEENEGGPPPLLSQTGCFALGGDDRARPVSDLIPYAPIAELWSDGAVKRRWMTVPDDLTVTLEPDGDFAFPPGTVLVKEFELDGAKVETRFLVRQADYGDWAAYSYAWNDEQTDAELVDELGSEKVWGNQVWQYPGRAQCFQCHTSIVGTALGPEAAQLNHDFFYEATSATRNQMSTLVSIGVVDTSHHPAPWTSLAAIADTTRSIEERARSYLHANCSSCHRPEGLSFTPLDLRYWTDFDAMNICDAAPSVSAMEDVIFPAGSSRILAPADPEHSQVYVRMAIEKGAYRMPPLGRTVTDTAALEVVGEWISSVATCE